MTGYLTSRDLPDVLSLHQVAAWTGLDEGALAERLSCGHGIPSPDGWCGRRPYWLAVTVLRWCPVRGGGHD